MWCLSEPTMNPLHGPSTTMAGVYIRQKEVSMLRPLDQHKFRVLAADEKTNRIILAIGRQRFARDMWTQCVKYRQTPPNAAK
jgi:hypothetical protein